MPLFRYRSPLLPYGVTRDAVGWLGPQKQRDVVLAWIEEHFDVRTSDHLLFDESDTFDVFEEVWDEFENLVPEDVIERALNEAAARGEWVKRHTPRKAEVERYDSKRLVELLRDLRTTGKVRLGTAAELRARAEFEAVISSLRRCIAEIEGISGALGDNGGPADVSTPAGQFAHLTAHISRIGKQLSLSAPSPVSVAESALAIQGVAESNHWMDEHIQTGTTAYVRSFCETAGKDHARMLNAALIAFIALVFGLLMSCIDWIEAAVVH